MERSRKGLEGWQDGHRIPLSPGADTGGRPPLREWGRGGRVGSFWEDGVLPFLLYEN